MTRACITHNWHSSPPRSGRRRQDQVTSVRNNADRGLYLQTRRVSRRSTDPRHPRCAATSEQYRDHAQRGRGDLPPKGTGFEGFQQGGIQRTGESRP